VLGKPKEKKWKDSNAYRFGMYHKYEKWTAMAGIAYDETPIPQRTLGFELPDSNGWIFSLGGIYSPNNKLELGIAGLYVTKKDRNVSNNINGINGKFSDLNAFLLNVSLGYKF
jgi:long-chain fatty acid transport protein